MKYQKGDLLYIPQLRMYPEEYVLVIEAKIIQDASVGSYYVFSLTENRKDYYNGEWLENKANKIG